MIEDTDVHQFEVVKVEPSLGLVFGWGIICKVDGQDYYDRNIDKETGQRVPEHIPETTMLEAASDFMENSRVAKEMHKGDPKGSVVFAFPMTTEIAKSLKIATPITGLLVAMKPTPEVLKKFESGEFTGFSIGGSTSKFEDVEVELAKFDPNQPRDDDGKWTDSGGGGGGGKEVTISGKKPGGSSWKRKAVIVGASALTVGALAALGVAGFRANVLRIAGGYGVPASAINFGFKQTQMGKFVNTRTMKPFKGALIGESTLRPKKEYGWVTSDLNFSNRKMGLWPFAIIGHYAKDSPKEALKYMWSTVAHESAHYRTFEFLEAKPEWKKWIKHNMAGLENEGRRFPSPYSQSYWRDASTNRHRQIAFFETIADYAGLRQDHKVPVSSRAGTNSRFPLTARFFDAMMDDLRSRKNV